MGDKEFLLWIANRLVYVYNESQNVDFVRRLRAIAERIPEKGNEMDDEYPVQKPRLSEEERKSFYEKKNGVTRCVYVSNQTMVGGLDFATLRAANEKRLPQFKNRRGQPAHSKEDGSDWSLSDWGVAAGGEMGELLSELKQYRRGDIDLAMLKERAGKEIADIIIYLDILAKQLGLNTGDIVTRKFDEVSRRVGSDVRLRHIHGNDRMEWIMPDGRIEWADWETAKRKGWV